MGKYTAQIVIYLIIVLLISCNNTDTTKQTVKQSSRDIPVIDTVDVLIYGGSSYAVGAAKTASENGATVFLVTAKPYLGEDLCATLRLQIDAEWELKTTIEKQLFGQEKSNPDTDVKTEGDETGLDIDAQPSGEKITTTPIRVKAKLNKILLDADNVRFLFGSYPTDIIWGGKSLPAGMIIANRAGRQAILAKTIIDATDNAWVCRMAGAKYRKWNGENIEFERTVLLEGNDKGNPEFIKKSISIPMPDLSFSSFANAEQVARDESYMDKQLRASENLFFIPPNPINCKKSDQQWNGNIDIAHFEVEDINNLYVLSGCADIPRKEVKELLRPAAIMTRPQKGLHNLYSLFMNSSVCSIKFKFEACEKSKPQNNCVFEDLDFEQQRRSWTL